MNAFLIILAIVVFPLLVLIVFIVPIELGRNYQTPPRESRKAQMQDVLDWASPNGIKHDWPDDMALHTALGTERSGVYYNTCSECTKEFLGNKFRRTCRVCAGRSRRFRLWLHGARYIKKLWKTLINGELLS